MKTKPTRRGVVSALRSLGYTSEADTPPALRGIAPAQQATPDESAFAKYLIHDNDFGGAWNDADQILMHTEP